MQSARRDMPRKKSQTLCCLCSIPWSYHGLLTTLGGLIAGGCWQLPRPCPLRFEVMNAIMATRYLSIKIEATVARALNKSSILSSRPASLVCDEIFMAAVNYGTALSRLATAEEAVHEFNRALFAARVGLIFNHHQLRHHPAAGPYLVCESRTRSLRRRWAAAGLYVDRVGALRAGRITLRIERPDGLSELRELGDIGDVRPRRSARSWMISPAH